MLQRNYTKFTAQGLLVVSLAMSCGLSAYGFNFGKHDKSEAKSTAPAVSEIQKPNSDETAKVAKSESAKEGAKSESSPSDKKTAKDTAKAVNTVPGVQVSEKDLQAPPVQEPIKGFHPIKKLLRPVENLEAMSIKLQQQIMKLEGPIAALQQPMRNLDTKMINVDSEIAEMKTQLGSMQSQISGVRADLHVMRKQIAQLQAPIESLNKPLSGVAKPLEQVQQQLNMVLAAIFFAAIAIAVGTPLAAILVYKNRHKIFPDLKEHELPKISPGTPASTRR